MKKKPASVRGTPGDGQADASGWQANYSMVYGRSRYVDGRFCIKVWLVEYVKISNRTSIDYQLKW